MRLRAILVERELALTGPGEFNLCTDCDMPCRRACPQEAFASGAFDRKRCSIQMRIDKMEGGVINGAGSPLYEAGLIKYCRACELACPWPA